jgi:hypothetical protein
MWPDVHQPAENTSKISAVMELDLGLADRWGNTFRTKVQPARTHISACGNQLETTPITSAATELVPYPTHVG